MTTNNKLPPGLVSNLQDVLLSRKPNATNELAEVPGSDTVTEAELGEESLKKPVVLVTNGDGIESPGLTYLVEALVREGIYNVHVCAPQSDKSGSGHSVTSRESIAVTSVQIDGATAYEVSGTTVDCVSLALSGALFSWSKPLLVVSGINRGSSCGHQTFFSGVVAGAREALMSGVPSVCISLDWKKDDSQDSDFKDAVTVCLPLINAAAKDIGQGNFPNRCFLDIEVPSSPLTNKGLKLTKQSLWRCTPNWQAISANRSTGRFMSNQHSLGLQLAQLSRDASAAGAARRLGTQKKSLEIVESVGVAGKTDVNRTTKYFRLEFMDKEQEDVDEDLDFRALENGFVAITPISLIPQIDSDIQTAVSEWISAAIQT